MPAFKVLIELPDRSQSRWVTMITRERTLELARQAAEMHFLPQRVKAVAWLHTFRDEGSSTAKDRIPIVVD